MDFKYDVAGRGPPPDQRLFQRLRLLRHLRGRPGGGQPRGRHLCRHRGALHHSRLHDERYSHDSADAARASRVSYTLHRNTGRNGRPRDASKLLFRHRKNQESSM